MTTAFKAIREGAANDLLGAKALDNGQMKPSLIGGNVGDVTNPGHIRPGKGKAAGKEIRRSRLAVVGICYGLVSVLSCGEDVQLPHQAMDAPSRAGKLPGGSGDTGCPALEAGQR